MTSGYTENREPFLTIAPIHDRFGRRILFLHAEGLDESLSEYDITSSLGRIQPSEKDVLIYFHGGLCIDDSTPTFSKVLSFRRIIDKYVKVVPAVVVALHVSFLSRAHLSLTSRFSGPVAYEIYNKLQYCDLIEDLEKLLCVDSTLLGLRAIDLHYDEIMRAWVGRKEEEEERHRRSQNNQFGSSSQDCFEMSSKVITTIDPSKPLIDINNISFHGTAVENEMRKREQFPFIGEQV